MLLFIAGMKVSTALQIFGTIMTSGGDNWQPGMPQTAIDITPRTDLDLCACLDVELADDLSQELYGDAVPQEATWEENVIDLTSSGEIASAGEVDFQEISSRETVMSDPNTYSTSSLSAEAMNYANMFGLGVTDNANLLPSENFQTGELNSTEFLTNTYPNPFRRLMTSAATTTTVDLSALESLSFNTDSSLQYVDDSTSSSYTSSVPSSLWNVDFVTACNPSGSQAPDSLLSGFPAEVDPVKETLKSRLQTRGMTSSAVQDGDSFCSSRLSQSSSTSSCTQSVRQTCRPSVL